MLVGEDGAVGVVYRGRGEPAPAGVLDRDGDGLGVGVVDVLLCGVVLLDDGVGVSLADVVLGVFDVREGHGAVGVVGPGVQDGSVGVPELEAELAVGENSAEEPLGGADLDGSGGFVGDEDVDGVGPLLDAVNGDGRGVGECPVAVGADISALVIGQVGGRGDRGGDGEDVLGLGVSVTGVLRRRRNGLPGYLDIPVVRHVDAVPADRHGRLRGVEGRIECVRHDDRVGPVAVGDVGERLGDVEGGGLAAPPDLPGRRFDGVGPFGVDGDPRVVADARGAGLAPPLGGVLRARLGDDRRAVGRRARGVLDPRSEPRVVIAHDEIGAPADDHIVLVTAHQVHALAPLGGEVPGARAVGGVVDRLVDVPVDDVHPVVGVDGRVRPRPHQGGREGGVDADGGRVVVIGLGRRERAVDPGDLEGREPSGLVKTVGLPGVHGGEVDDRVDPLPGGGVADVIEPHLEPGPRRAGVGQLSAVGVAPHQVGPPVLGVVPGDVPAVADAHGWAVLGVLIGRVEFGEVVPGAVRPELPGVPVGGSGDVDVPADGAEDVVDRGEGVGAGRIGPGKENERHREEDEQEPGQRAPRSAGPAPLPQPSHSRSVFDGPPRRIRVTQFLRAAAQPTACESSSRHGRVPMESHMDTECCARIAGGSRRGDFPHRTRISAYRRAPVSARSSPESARSAPPVRTGPGSWWDRPRSPPDPRDLQATREAVGQGPSS